MMQTTALGDDGAQAVCYRFYVSSRGACRWEEFCDCGVMGLGRHQLGELRMYATKEEIHQHLLGSRTIIRPRRIRRGRPGSSSTK